MKIKRSQLSRIIKEELGRVLNETSFRADVEMGLRVGAANPVDLDVAEKFSADIKTAKQNLLNLLSTTISEGEEGGDDPDSELHDLLMTPLASYKNNARSLVKSVGMGLEGLGGVTAGLSLISAVLAAVPSGLAITGGMGYNDMELIFIGITGLAGAFAGGTVGTLIGYIIGSAGAAITSRFEDADDRPRPVHSLLQIGDDDDVGEEPQ